MFSYLRTLTTWHCPHLPTTAAAIDRFLLPTGPTAANLQQRVCCCGPMLGQTSPADRRTDTVPFHRPCSTYYAYSANKSAFSLVTLLSTLHLLLSAVMRVRAAAPLLLGARRPPLSIDISCSHGAQQQTRRTPLLRSNDGTVDGRIDAQTDRGTDTGPLYRPCSAYCTGSANNNDSECQIS